MRQGDPAGPLFANNANWPAAPLLFAPAYLSTLKEMQPLAASMIRHPGHVLSCDNTHVHGDSDSGVAAANAVLLWRACSRVQMLVYFADPGILEAHVAEKLQATFITSGASLSEAHCSALGPASGSM